MENFLPHLKFLSSFSIHSERKVIEEENDSEIPFSSR